MKRDMDLARAILIEIEKKPYDMDCHDIKIDGYSQDTITYHVMLMNEAGLIEALDLSSNSGSEWKPKRLTWKGHEFLDASRNDTIWNQAKKKISESGLSFSFDIMYKALLNIINGEFS